MCGISGIVSLNGNALLRNDLDNVVSMNVAIKHRGPDYDEVNQVSETCILGHVRLSIIDVSSASNQPMVSACGRYSIVFNGEIYNYIEIKNKYGLVTKSSGDTEVLLESIAKVGFSILKELNGIFAFALYDKKKNELTISRDRFGVKPLYYTFEKNNLYFSSEIKGLTCLTNIKKIFNDTKLSDFFTFLTLPGKDTFFKNINKVMPGEVITFSYKTNKSYTFSEPVQDLLIQSTITNKKLYKDFSNTVNRQSVADVSLGLFLSGGVDSNGILDSLINNNINPEVYTAYFESDHDSYSSELDKVDRVVEENNIVLHKVKITRDLFWGELDNVIFHQDEPLADPVSIPVYFLSQQVEKNNSKVIHVGEGADELFFGYESWRKLELLQFLQYPQKFLNKIGILKILNLFSFIICKIFPARYSEAWRRLVNNLPLFWGGTDALTYNEKKKIGINSKLLDKTDKIIKKSYENFLDKFDENSPNKWMTYFDLKIRLPELMLMRVDKMAMAFGIEARVPFLDNELANIAWNIPIKHKRTKKSMKHIFKKALEKNISKDILYAKKLGFNAPAEEWCQEESVKVLREIKLFCDHSNTLNFREIHRLCASTPRHTWRFYVLSRWYNLNFNNDSIYNT